MGHCTPCVCLKNKNDQDESWRDLRCRTKMLMSLHWLKRFLLMWGQSYTPPCTIRQSERQIKLQNFNYVLKMLIVHYIVIFQLCCSEHLPILLLCLKTQSGGHKRRIFLFLTSPLWKMSTNEHKGQGSSLQKTQSQAYLWPTSAAILFTHQHLRNNPCFIHIPQQQPLLYGAPQPHIN